jgi:hypothetical protein
MDADGGQPAIDHPLDFHPRGQQVHAALTDHGTRPKRVEHGKGAADDTARQFIQPDRIRVHSRTSAFICVKRFLLLCRRQMSADPLTHVS